MRRRKWEESDDDIEEIRKLEREMRWRERRRRRRGEGGRDRKRQRKKKKTRLFIVSKTVNLTC